MRIYWLLFYIISSLALQAQEDAFNFDYRTNDDNSIDILYTKQKPGCYHLKFEFASIDNSISSGFNGSICHNSGTLIHLKPINPKQGIGFNPKVFYFLGKVKPKIDEGFIYRLPIKEGEESTIWEHSNLNEEFFEGKKIDTWKSFFINSKKSDSIFAMRKGIVVSIDDKHNTEATSKDKYYTSQINTIQVEHKDGTFASYSGFNKKLMNVKLGQTVYPHTYLGSTTLNNKDYRLSFSIYYLNKELSATNKPKSLNKQENFYNYVDPLFATRDGISKIKKSKTYTAIINNEIITKELSRRESKKFKKNPDLLNN